MLVCQKVTYDNTEDNGSRILVYGSIVIVASNALEGVTFISHVVTDDKNSCSYDGSTVHVCPLIRRLWNAFC